MSLFKSNEYDNATTAGATNDLLDRNLCTSAATYLSAGAVGASGGLMLAAFPAQTIALGVTIGGLYYAGDRQYRDLPLNPFEKTEKSTTDKATAEAAA